MGKTSGDDDDDAQRRVQGGNRGQWRSQEIFAGEQIQGVWGTEVPQWGPGAKPRWESGGEDDFTMKK